MTTEQDYASSPTSDPTPEARTAAWSAAVAGFAEALKSQQRGYLSVTDSTTTTRSAATQATYLKHVQWLADSAPCGPWDLESHQLLTWLDGHNWSRDTRRKVLVSLRAFYAWAISQHHLEWAPTAGLPSAARRTPGPKARTVPEPWLEPLRSFESALRAAGRTEGTISQYRFRLRLLSEVTYDPWALDHQRLAQWLSNPDWAPQTKRCSVVAVTAFYRWAVKTGRTTRNPADDLDPVRVPRGVPRPAPREAVSTALRQADDRTRLAIMLALYAGLRVAEIAALHCSQITDTHLFVVGKGGHARLVPLDPDGDLAQALRAEIGRRRNGSHGTGWRDRFTTESGYLFPSSHHPGPLTAAHLGKIIARALPEQWTAHPLRHRFATDAYAVDRDLQAVQQLLGHSRPETTAVYAQIPDGALLAAVRGAATHT